MRPMTNTVMRWMRAAALCCVSALASAAGHEIVGYYPGWAAANPTPFVVNGTNIAASRLTVINYAFLDICWDGQHGNASPAADGALKPCRDRAGKPIKPPDGAIVLGDPALDVVNLRQLVKLKATHPQLKLMASVGGWNWSNQFSNMAASEATRSNFVDSAVAFVRAYRFDGIDLDWEFPTAIGLPCVAGAVCQRPEDKQNYVLLIDALRWALDLAGQKDHKRYLVTIAAGAGTNHVMDASGSSAWLVALAKSVDWINIMAYDYHGPWDTNSGLLAPLFVDSNDSSPTALTFNADASVKLFLDQGIAPNKLVLGLPFYGYGWAGCAPGPNADALYQPCSGAAVGSKGANFDHAFLVDAGYLTKDTNGAYSVGGKGFIRHWNAAAKVPYLYNADSKVFISYEDEASVHEKAIYIQGKGLRGAMFWELNADRHKILGRVLAKDLPH